MFFVHIPKTAGNYVRTILKKVGLVINEPNFGDRKEKHLMAKDNIYRFNPDTTPAPFPDNYFKNYLRTNEYQKSKYSFTVVRDPLSLLKSYYFHGKKHKFGWGHFQLYHPLETFDKFVDFYCNCDPEEWHVPELNKSLFSQIYDENESSKVNFALYYESLDDQIFKLIEITDSKLISKNYKLIKLLIYKGTKKNQNRMSNKNYTDFYSNKLKNMVKKKCEKIYDNFEFSNKSEKKKLKIFK